MKSKTSIAVSVFAFVAWTGTAYAQGPMCDAITRLTTPSVSQVYKLLDALRVAPNDEFGDFSVKSIIDNYENCTATRHSSSMFGEPQRGFTYRCRRQSDLDPGKTKEAVKSCLSGDWLERDLVDNGVTIFVRRTAGRAPCYVTAIILGRWDSSYLSVTDNYSTCTW